MGETRDDSEEREARLARDIQHGLDRLLEALTLEPLGGDRFRAPSEPGRFADRIFGGQSLGQALRAAGLTAGGRPAHSLHAVFVEAGRAAQPVEITVERVRDGGSLSTRRVAVEQGERHLLTALVSFHDGPDAPELGRPAPEAPAPDSLPRLQSWVWALPPESRGLEQRWVDQPPPLELRIGEPPRFLRGPVADGPRWHWLRLPRDVGDEPALHQALLAYASDYLLLDMALRARPEPPGEERVAAYSLDHALWLHRPVRLDRWHLYTQELQALTGHRGLVRGALHDADGHLVATAMQEVVVRPVR